MTYRDHIPVQPGTGDLEIAHCIDVQTAEQAELEHVEWTEVAHWPTNREAVEDADRLATHHHRVRVRRVVSIVHESVTYTPRRK